MSIICERCQLRTIKGHETVEDCLKDALKRLNYPDAIYDLSNRTLHFIPNMGVPEANQFVLVASFGNGGLSAHHNATHTVSLCIDETTRVKLIEILGVKP